MATVSSNTVNKQDLKATTYKINPAESINQGDMLMWDAANFRATAMTALTDGDKFVGIAGGQQPPAGNVLVTPTAIDRMPVVHKGTVSFKATAGETYLHGSAVVMGADVQTVALQGGADAADVIGFVYIPENGANILATATTILPVLLRANFPAAGLLN